MHFQDALGLNTISDDSAKTRQKLHQYINLKLASCGQPTCSQGDSTEFLATANDLVSRYLEMSRQLSARHCPSDQRIQTFLNSYKSFQK